MKEKLSKIILPYISISSGFLVTYSFFYWLFCIRLKLIEFESTIIETLVPFAISIFLILFYFRKKLQLLKTTTKYREFTLFVSLIFLTAPILTFQFYIKRETGKITHLKSVDEILTHKPTMYYTIGNSVQHKNKSGVFITKGYADRGNEIGIECYYTCPITNNDDSIQRNNIWIGTMFGKKISNRVLDKKENQDKLISKFIDSSSMLYKKYQFKTSFLRRLSNSEEKNNYLKAIQQTNIIYNDQKLIILKEEIGNYESRTGKSLWWTISIFITSNIFWILLTIFCKVKKNKTIHITST